MKKSEIYLFVSIVLFLVSFCIIPVGGLTDSDPYYQWYLKLFAFAEVNALVSIIVFWRANREKKSCE